MTRLSERYPPNEEKGITMPIAPRSTGADAQDDPFRAFSDLTLKESAIYDQKADGQHPFITSDTLPTRMGEKDREALNRAGTVFGDQVPGDEIFTDVTLPAGWKKVETGNRTWFDLVDDRGRKRASIFYETALCGRSAAHLITNRRFDIRKDYEHEDAENAIQYTVTDGTVVVFTTNSHPFTGKKCEDDWCQKNRCAYDEALSWLKENFPDWENTGAYWD